jgi:hypothetical protein
MAPAVIITGLSTERVGGLDGTDGSPKTASARELEFILARERVQVVVIGPDVDLHETCRHLARCADRLRETGTVCIVIGAADVDEFARALEGVNHYVCPGVPEPAAIGTLVKAALCDTPAVPDGLHDRIVQDPEVLGFFRTLEPGRGLAWVLSHIERAVGSILRAERCHCVFTTLRVDGSMGDRAASSSSGLTGYIAMTGEPARLDAGCRDPRWYTPADAGRPDPVHFLGVAIPGRGRRALGVLTAHRASDAEPFSSDDLLRAQALVAAAAPALEFAHARATVEVRLLAEAHEAGQPLFRPEGSSAGIDSRSPDDGRENGTIAREPAWLPYAFSLCIVAAALLLSILSVKSVEETRELPFVIRAADAEGNPELVVALARPDDTVDLARLRVSVDVGSGVVTVPVSAMTVERVSAAKAESLGLPHMPGASADRSVVRATLPRAVPMESGRSVQLEPGMTGVARFSGGSHPLLFELLPGWLSGDSRADRRPRG